MTDRFYWFLLAALGVWRLTHLISSEDGPFHCFVRLRRAVEGRRWGDALNCFYCLSLWVAMPAAIWIGAGVLERVLLWLALSGAAILLERVTAGASPAAEYFEHQGEQDNVVLWKERQHQRSAKNL